MVVCAVVHAMPAMVLWRVLHVYLYIGLEHCSSYHIGSNLISCYCPNTVLGVITYIIPSVGPFCLINIDITFDIIPLMLGE